MRALLPSGTSGNESIHHEVNRWLRNHHGKYVPTLQIQLQVNIFGKLQAHSAARYTPSLRQTSQATLLAATIAKLTYPLDSWATLCLSMVEGPTQLPLLMQRKQMQQLVKEKSKRRRIVQKTPAANVMVKRHSKKSAIKRHAFNVKRVR